MAQPAATGVVKYLIPVHDPYDRRHGLQQPAEFGR